MTTRPVALALALSLALAVTARSPAAGQNPPPPPPPAPAQGRQISALMVDVVVSRHLGEKRLSSTPYTVSVSPDQRSSLRIGGTVPIPSTTFVTPASKEDGKPAAPMVSYGYREIGTNIDVAAGPPQPEGRYRITVTIDETSIYADELAPATTKTTGAPAFRGFKSTNTLVMRDGQSIDYTMATDRLTGEVYRVSVKLTVVN
jgi:hypothetical protein